jgi:2'-5' RNA ligase
VSRTVRLFVALPLPGKIVNELEKWVVGNKNKLSFRKWVHPYDCHITLQFLGETLLEKVEELRTALRKREATPFTLVLNGVGVFGSPRSPRVLWAGVSGRVDELKALHLGVVEATRPLGFVPEERPYTSHITLARGFTGREIFTIGEITPPPPLEWTVDRFTLMQTHMNKSPMYEVVEEFQFGSESNLE